MSRSVTHGITITNDNAYGYWSAESGMEINAAPYSVTAVMGTKSTSTVYASANSAAMAIMFPTATCKPYQCQFKLDVGKPIGNSTSYGYVLVGGTTVGSGSQSSMGSSTVSFTSSVSAVTSATRSTAIKLGLKTSNSRVYSTWCQIGGSDAGYFYFSYYIYSFSATAGTGIASVSCPSEAYNGDTVTYSCTLKPNYEFVGWYNGSTLVSTSQTYSFTSGADVALTAVAKSTVTYNTITVAYNGSNILTFESTENVNVGYNGSTIASLSKGTSKTLKCSGKLAVSNITVGSYTLKCAKKKFATNIVVTCD